MNADDKDKNVYLEFEGVYQNAFVYVNNSFAGKCPYGYSNFYVDITKYLNYNEPNALKVVVKMEFRADAGIQEAEFTEMSI